MMNTHSSQASDNGNENTLKVSRGSQRACAREEARICDAMLRVR